MSNKKISLQFYFFSFTSFFEFFVQYVWIIFTPLLIPHRPFPTITITWNVKNIMNFWLYVIVVLGVIMICFFFHLEIKCDIKRYGCVWSWQRMDWWWLILVVNLSTSKLTETQAAGHPWKRFFLLGSFEVRRPTPKWAIPLVCNLCEVTGKKGALASHLLALTGNGKFIHPVVEAFLHW